MELSRSGSTRVMTAAAPGVIKVKYTDSFSVFDRGASTQTIPGMGRSRCACAVASFLTMRAANIPTHFVDQLDPITFSVREFSVPGHESLSGSTDGEVLNGEWIWRDKLKGSAWARVRDPHHERHLPIEAFGFLTGTTPVEGMQLPRLFLECTTKFEEVDRHLTDDEAQKLMGLTDQQWAEGHDLINLALKALNARYKSVGIDSIDGKFELGRLHNGRIVQVDVAGTPDENRLIDIATGRVLCKDVLRDWFTTYDNGSWKAALDAAKKAYPHDKSKWPPYPKLPDDFVAHVAAIYAEVALRYAGVMV